MFLSEIKKALKRQCLWSEPSDISQINPWCLSQLVSTSRPLLMASPSWGKRLHWSMQTHLHSEPFGPSAANPATNWRAPAERLHQVVPSVPWIFVPNGKQQYGKNNWLMIMIDGEALSSNVVVHCPRMKVYVKPPNQKTHQHCCISWPSQSLFLFVVITHSEPFSNIHY